MRDVKGMCWAGVLYEIYMTIMEIESSKIQSPWSCSTGQNLLWKGACGREDLKQNLGADRKGHLLKGRFIIFIYSSIPLPMTYAGETIWNINADTVKLWYSKQTHLHNLYRPRSFGIRPKTCYETFMIKFAYCAMHTTRCDVLLPSAVIQSCSTIIQTLY